MTFPAEKLEPFEIHNEDDVWNALYIFGIKDSFGAILKYYRNETTDTEEKRKGAKKRFRQIRTKDLENFFKSLDIDQQQEALTYFIGEKDKEGFILFYQSLNQSGRRAVIEKMLFEVFEIRPNEEIGEEIRKLRNRLFKNHSPESLDEAINAALQDNPGKTVLFLKENMFQIPKFIDTAPEDVAISVLLEMLKCIPN